MKYLLLNIIYIGILVKCDDNNILNSFVYTVDKIIKNVSSQNITDERPQIDNLTEKIDRLIDLVSNSDENDNTEEKLCDKCGCGSGRCSPDDLEKLLEDINAQIEDDSKLFNFKNLKVAQRYIDDSFSESKPTKSTMITDNTIDELCNIRCGCGSRVRDRTDGHIEEIDDEMCYVRCGCGRSGRFGQAKNIDRNNEDVNDDFCSVRCGCGSRVRDRTGYGYKNAEGIDKESYVRCGCRKTGRCGCGQSRGQVGTYARNKDYIEDEICSARCGCRRPGRSNRKDKRFYEKGEDSYDIERCGCGKPSRCGNPNNLDTLIDDVNARLEQDRGYTNEKDNLNNLLHLFNLRNRNDELQDDVCSIRCGCKKPSRYYGGQERSDTSNWQNINRIVGDSQAIDYREPQLFSDKVDIVILSSSELDQLLRSFGSINHKKTQLTKDVKPNLLKILLYEIYNLEKTKSNERHQMKQSRITYAPQEIAKFYNQFKDEVTVRIFNYIKEPNPKKDLPYLTIKPRREFQLLKKQLRKRKLSDAALKEEIIDMLVGKKGNIRILPHKRLNNYEMIVPSWLYSAFYKMRRHQKKNSKVLL